MPHIHSKTHRPATAVLLLLLLSLALAACGGSSKGASSSKSASASATGAARAPAGRFAAVRECLQKNGITLPKRTPGQQRAPGAGGFLGGGAGPRLPAGVTRAQYEAALKKCGGAPRSGFKGRLSSPTLKAALGKFASCMRAHGVNLAAPNTSGKGPVFNTTGIDTGSARFKTAEASCRSGLGGLLPGGGGGPAGGRAPGGGEAP
jgi:hypothetical protein